jgi:hypothetical protein
MFLGDQKFYAGWNKTFETTLVRGKSRFSEAIIGHSQYLNFKEISTYTRQPNRMYNQPLYGYLSQRYEFKDPLARNVDAINRLLMKVYGGSTIVLKKHIAKRTLFSFFDSSFQLRDFPLLFNEAKKAKYILDRNLLKIHVKSKMVTIPYAYIEAKFLGGISFKDFDYILTPWNYYLLYRKYFKKIQKLFPHIKVKIRMPWDLLSQL